MGFLRINLRLNDKKHKDIIDALSNHKNVSEEVRRLLRIAINIGNCHIEPLTSSLVNNNELSNNKNNKNVTDDEIKQLEESFAFIDFGADE